MKNRIGQNITFLRKARQLTQEELAERIGVSRQAVAKWESGETAPDLRSCCAIAELFDVTLDDLVHYDRRESGLPIPPRGKHLFGAVTVGERGHISIPKRARELFHIQPGDQLLVLGDEERGLALLHQRDLMRLAEAAGLLPKEGCP